MQKGINFTEVLHVMWFSLVLWFDITHTHTKTSHLLCAQSSCLYYNEVIVYWHQKFTLQSFIMALLFKNYSLIEVMYLLIRFNKTRCFPQNTKNTAKNGTNKQHTHTHTHKTKPLHSSGAEHVWVWLIHRLKSWLCLW